jgi:predicted DsbA family dithiol-disulfide isomerase
VRIERARQAYNVEFRWIHFPLHPDTPLEGQSLEQLFAGRNIDIDAMFTRMKGLMDEEGLLYSTRTHTYNSRLAQELGAWADTQEGGEPLHDALYRAYFVDGKNIGDLDTLVGIAADGGLPEDQARAVLENREFKSTVDEDWDKSRKYGVTGVPTFVAGGYGIVGAQPYESIEELLRQSGAQPRAQA